jgi:hypothetical protein
MGKPHTVWITLGAALFMRVPCPAAITIAPVVALLTASPGSSLYHLKRASAARSRKPSRRAVGYNLAPALEDFMRKRPATPMKRARVLGALVPALVGAAASTACSNDFDQSRILPARGTLGEELFGVVCDRLGAQSLHEDLTGASFRGVCHRRVDGTFADKIDPVSLPPIVDNAPDLDGKPVPSAKQQADRAYGIARLETLARHRADLIAALDATFPDIQVPIKDLANPDPTASCSPPAASGQGSLHAELANLLGRFQDLYGDGTIPQSTESLARVIDAFKASPDAQRAWARLDARAGYRPIDVAIGAARPVIAYPHLRDFTNATLKLLSADSDPYAPNPQRDAQGNRIPVPGGAYPQLAKLLEVGHAELANATPDAAAPLLGVQVDAMTKRTVLSRPRTDLEMLQAILYAQDAAFGGGTSRYIVQRDPRGYVSVPPAAGGAVPAPFVDKDGDGLPDVDDLGRFVTSNGSSAPSPFFAIGAPDALARDAFGRALAAPGGAQLYGYIDTSHTYTASLVKNLGPLVDANPADNHETLMDFSAGARVLLGARDGSPATAKVYDDGTTVQYDAFHTDSSPLVDFVYALGQVMADPTTDDTLAFASALVAQHPNDVARVVGDGLYAKGLADKDTVAHLPATSTFWDEVIDLAIQIEKEPGLLEDVLRALGDDASLPLNQVFSTYMSDLDRISYDRQHLNGPAFNFNTNSTAQPSTPVNRSQADSGANRSEMQRFLQAIHDTNGVTACNKDQAVVHAQGLPLIGSADICSGPLAICALLGSHPFSECEVFKIDNLAAFYLDSVVGKASLYFRPGVLRNGIAGIGAATVGVIEQSSGIGYDAGDADANNGADVTKPGFWDLAGTQTFRPKPGWLNRLVFFDLGKDSPNQGDTNYTTNHFLADLQGPNIGTAACPERVIPDPDPGAQDASPDGKVHGLRSCADGEWFFQRDQDATFVWEDVGFYHAMAPLMTAFVNHGREDLFIGLMEVLHKHWQTAQGTAEECKLAVDPATGKTVTCAKDGADTYEPLMAQIFGSDLLTALHDLVKTVGGMDLPACTAADPATHACTQATTKNGIAILADATRALVDPDRAKAAGLKDRGGNVTSVRNDGTRNPQVTPIYLVLETLDGVDAAFAAYAKSNPQDANRQAQWRRARSQLVDQFLSVNGQNTTTQTFADASLPKILPILIDALRAQLAAHCPGPPYGSCAWARTDLVKNVTTTMQGPTFAAAIDLMEAIRKDDAGRAETEKLLGYLVDAASSNDALAEVLSSADDLVQVLRDDDNLVPLYHVLASAMVATRTDKNGNTQRGVVDATTALLARVAGRAFDSQQREICAGELDPNAVLDVGLAHLVTPMQKCDAAGRTCTPSETPLEIIVDAIADINRASPGAPDKLQGTDYANVANEVSEFLKDDQRGLEQFYEIVRQGTVK